MLNMCIVYMCVVYMIIQFCFSIFFIIIIVCTWCKFLGYYLLQNTYQSISQSTYSSVYVSIYLPIHLALPSILSFFFAYFYRFVSFFFDLRNLFLTSQLIAFLVLFYIVKIMLIFIQQ